MKTFNTILGTLTAALIATTLALTAATWIDGPAASDAHLASAPDLVLVQND